MIRLMLVAVGATILLATTSVAAAPADHPAALVQVLRAIDVVPTAPALEAAAAPIAPEDALEAVALDGAMPLYERKRAASLLSVLPTPLAARHMATLARASIAVEVRATAVYTFVRSQAGPGPAEAEALDLAEAALASDAPIVREAAVRGLRWVTAPAAEALVAAAEAAEQDPRVKAAIRRFWQTR